MYKDRGFYVTFRGIWRQFFISRVSGSLGQCRLCYAPSVSCSFPCLIHILNRCRSVPLPFRIIMSQRVTFRHCSASAPATAGFYHLSSACEVFFSKRFSSNANFVRASGLSTYHLNLKIQIIHLVEKKSCYRVFLLQTVPQGANVGYVWNAIKNLNNQVRTHQLSANHPF